MHVLLTRTIEKLGRQGDVVQVAGGYARNFLIPQGLATEPTPDNLLRLASKKKRYEEELLVEKAQYEQLAERLQASSCTIAAKADENGHLYGSVSEAMIAQAFETDGIPLDPKALALAEPIKQLGVYDISVNLHPEVTATAKVWVVEDN